MRKLYDILFNRYWNPYLAVGLAGLLSAIYFGLTKTVWAVTGEFTRFGGHILRFFRVNIEGWEYFNLVKMDGTPFTRTDGWIIWGMLIGSLITVLMSNNFKIRFPRQKRRYLQGFIGGIIAGFGARLALGCNLAALFTGIPQFSFHAWIFMFTTAAGTFFGVKIVNSRWWKGTSKVRLIQKMQAFPAETSEQSPKKRIRQAHMGLLLACLFLLLIIYFLIQGKTLLAIAAVFGSAFGILIERGQICFTSAFRDMWVSGRVIMAKALSAGMIISVLITFYFLNQGMEPVLQVSAPSTFLGGLLFGIGIVLAGGCETGWMYRAMEGQVYFWVVGAGNIIGASFLAFAWDHLGLYKFLVEGWEPIYLIDRWGSTQALFATLALLFAWFIFSHWWGKNYRFGRGIQRKGRNDQKRSLLS